MCRKSPTSTRFSRAQLDQLRSLVPIGQVAGSYKRRCPCPFCGRQTEDMQLYQERDQFFCFRCRKGGDVFSWVQLEHPELSFNQVVRKVALMAGEALTPPAERLEVLNAAMAYYREALTQSPRAQAWLKARGLGEEVWFQAGLGYADGIPPDMPLGRLKAVRLVNDFDGQPSPYYDRRIVFPIYSADGDVVHMQGRTIGLDRMADRKYMALPGETEWGTFSINDWLYGEDQIKRHLDVAYFCEGIPDALTVRQYGLAAFAVLGRDNYARYGHRLRMLKKLYVLLDNDQYSQGDDTLMGLVGLQARMPQTELYHVVLPKPEGVEKMDVNQWYCDQGHPSRDQFETMIQAHARPVLERLMELWVADPGRHEQLVDLINYHPDREYWLRMLAIKAREDYASVAYLAKVRRRNDHGYTAAS